MLKKFFSVLAIFNLIFQSVLSQVSYEPKNFRTFSPKEGFYNDKVTALLQDNNGFIWIGTTEGLYKYNGWKFEQFNDINKFVSGSILHLFKDKDGNIWIGSNTGLSVYQKKSGKFFSIQFPASEEYFITAISQDATGLIWTSTNKGIYSVTDNHIANIRWHSERPGVLFRMLFYNNKYWLINYNCIYNFDSRRGVLTDSVHFNHYTNTADNLQTAFNTDGHGNIWIGKYNGIIYKFNTNSRSLSILDIKKKTNNPAAIINHLCYDSITNIIWASVDEGGIYKINPLNNSISPFINDLNHSSGIPTLKITNVLIDRERNVWLSMEKNGLAMTNELINSFSFLNPKPHSSTSIISASLKDTKGNIWLGTDGGGLLLYGPDYHFKNLFKHDSQNNTSISNNAILAITEDSKGRIWIGSFRGGLSLFHQESNSFTNYLTQNDVRKIVEDKDGTLWLILHGQGVAKFNPITNKYSLYNHLSSEWTNDLVIDRKGTIWVASNGGISYFDSDKDSFISLKSTQINTAFNTLHEDRSGTLWVGSSKGIYFLDKHKGILKTISQETVLSNTSIKCIEESKNGDLILATNKGLILYNPANQKTSFFTSESGLPSEEFIVNSSSSYNNKLILLGTNKGLCYFIPASLKTLNLTSKPIITSISVFNEPIEKIKSLDASVMDITSLDLSYKQNNITIAFSYPYYTYSSSEYNFQYMMEGIDKGWKSATSPIAVYPSLPPGKFRFRLRVINKAFAQQHSPETIITVVISPPFWDTWWFRLTSLLVITFCVYYYFRQKTKNILKVNKALEEKVFERTDAISKQKELLEKQRAELAQANQSKDKLFSIIAHDLRSPFNSILSITSLFQNKHEMLSQEDQVKMISLLRSSAENAFQLLENLLEWAKSQTSSIYYNPEKVSLTKLCEKVIFFYKKAAEDKEIQLKLIYDSDIVAFSDKEMLRTILRNLISNAIKFTPKGGTVSIKISHTSSNQFSIEVTDTGKGMSDTQIDLTKKVNSSLVPQHGTIGEHGTGLGLWICKELLSYINGEWNIISVPNKGTTFVISVDTDIEALSIHTIEEKKVLPVLQSPAILKTEAFALKQKNKVVLIVEDQTEVLEPLRYFLKDYFQLLIARDGIEAWEILQDNYIDLILSDIIMPRMDGVTFSIKCKEQLQTSHIPIILLTSQKDEIDMIKGLQSGVDDYLIKPVNSEILLLKINHLLNTRDLLKKKFSLETNEILSSIKEHSGEKEFLEKVLQLIDENLHKESFGVEPLSKLMGMHRSSLSKKLVSVTEITPNELIKIQRLKKAAKLLLLGKLTVSQIAFEVGFSDPKYFSRSFKAYFGSLPSEYIQMKKSMTKEQ